MIFVYENKKLHYEYFVKNKSFPTVVLLHGWGGNYCSFNPLLLAFENYNILTLDFWGFGESEKPNVNFSLFSYSKPVLALINYLNLTKCVLLGHSFGGRVALVLGADYPNLVQGMVLLDSAGIKPRFNLRKALKVQKYKFTKFLVNHKCVSARRLLKYGSADYKKLTDDEKRVFNSIINLDLSGYAKKIDCKTLIVWGENDKDTPLYMAKKLHKYISNSNLFVVKNAGHFSYLDSSKVVNKIVKDFLNELY